jgi:hypothetical protein
MAKGFGILVHEAVQDEAALAEADIALMLMAPLQLRRTRHPQRSCPAYPRSAELHAASLPMS